MNPNYTIRLAGPKDLAFTDELEKEALPIIDPYYRKNIEIFTEEIPGDLVMVFDGEEALGMGRYSFHPDGTMWLETVRVRPDHQGQGIGTAIYEKYLDVAREKGVKTVRLYTESFNEKSMALTKKMGFSIILRYDYYSKLAQDVSKSSQNVPEESQKVPVESQDVPGDALGFRVEKDLDGVMETLRENPWTDLLCMNNVFYEGNEANIRWFLDRGMVYRKGESLMICGARHNRDSVAYLAYLTGNRAACVQAALAMNHGKTLSAGISKGDPTVGKYFKDFEKRYDLVVSEISL